MDKRPAVSSIKTSYPPRVACCFARFAIFTAFSPLTIGKVSTPICAPNIANCSIAAGRLVSKDAIKTFLLFFSFNRFASLADVVVLPEPCRPTIRIGAGGLSTFNWPAFSSFPVKKCTNSS